MTKKINDIMKITLCIAPIIPSENPIVTDSFDDNDFEHNYYIHFFTEEKCIGNIDFHLEAGCYPDYLDDIEGCIKEELPKMFPEVTDYEIFDVDNTGEFRKAKVRIKAVKI